MLSRCIYSVVITVFDPCLLIVSCFRLPPRRKIKICLFSVGDRLASFGAIQKLFLVHFGTIYFYSVFLALQFAISNISVNSKTIRVYASISYM